MFDRQLHDFIGLMLRGHMEDVFCPSLLLTRFWMDLLCISRSSAVRDFRPTLQTLGVIQSSTSFAQGLFGLPLLFVPLYRHLVSSSPPHPSPKVSLAFLCCSSHSTDTWSHPVLHILRPRSLWPSSAVRPTLQTLALIQSSTSFAQGLFGFPLLFVPLYRHLLSSSPPHPSPKVSLAFLCCSSHSTDTCSHPVLHILRPRSLWLSSVVRPTLQTLALIQSSTSFAQGLFGLPLLFL